jgi:predicted DNA binding CopG/RHH family protein
MSFSAAKWLEEMINSRANELGMNFSQYIRYLVEQDQGGDLEIEPDVAGISKGATSTSFLSFSADPQFREKIDSRAATLGMSRSWYIRNLIQKDASHRGGSVVIKRRPGAKLPPRVKDQSKSSDPRRPRKPKPGSDGK